MNSAEVPIYEQIMNQIKAAILSGELEEGDVLPVSYTHLDVYKRQGEGMVYPGRTPCSVGR